MHTLTFASSTRRRWLRRAGSLALLLAAGCAGVPESPALPLAEVRAGVHLVRLHVPTGWQHADHGREQRFERGIAQISMTDLGPVSGAAFRREVNHARSLFRRGQVEDSRLHMQRLDMRRAVADDYRWEKLEQPWRRLCAIGQGREVSYHEAQWDYEQLLAQLTMLPDPDLARLAHAVLAELEDARRGVAETEELDLDGRRALRVDTWDRLSHDFRKRHLFVLNEGNLLVFRMELGGFEELQPAFDGLVASLQMSAGQGAS